MEPSAAFQALLNFSPTPPSVALPKAEILQGLIERHGWDSIYPLMIKTLRDDRAGTHWPLITDAFLTAEYEEWEYPKDLVIALIWWRLKDDSSMNGSDILNQFTSLVCQIKGWSYVGDWSPEDDPGVSREFSKLTQERPSG